ncbi:hypothetical protein [Niallia oryzisoli]|uniref:hypothetical protein n=1 Tax=Niallia oryzisoli TaxID=1737571 RepID=UPI003736D654
MKKMHGLIVLLLLLPLAACQKDIPEPETKDVSFYLNEAVHASAMNSAQDDSFYVKYHVRGKDVFFECIVKNASFRNHGARIVFSIDGKKTTEFHSAAFIVKDLPSGTHHAKLELFKENENVAAAVKEMEISIQ